LGIGDWGLGPIPNPQSPIPNPHPHFFQKYFEFIAIIIKINKLIKNINGKKTFRKELNILKLINTYII